MQRESLSAYIGIALKAGYVIIGSDKLATYNKKLYLVLLDTNAQKSSRKVYEKLIETGIEGREIENLGELNNKTYKIIGIKNKGLADEILKQIN